jgi:hypothetical protein
MLVLAVVLSVLSAVMSVASVLVARARIRRDGVGSAALAALSRMVYRCECSWRGTSPKQTEQGPRCPLCGSLV